MNVTTVLRMMIKLQKRKRKKKSVEFDCEGGVHDRGMKSKW